MADFTSLGKWVFCAGAALAAAGAVLWLAGRAGIPAGRLPGDLRIEGEKFTFYFPVVTCVIASIVLTILLNLVLRWFRK
jgi:hypothetical protein